ncbi:hypothetical protein EHI44_04690 [Rhizobium leguminosarum]|nr:hypothetical protein EHI44_04690 [Rhizobium leguminosarum]
MMIFSVDVIAGLSRHHHKRRGRQYAHQIHLKSSRSLNSLGCHPAANLGPFAGNGKRAAFGKSQIWRAAETSLTSLENIT